MMTYLDYNATTPSDPHVCATMQPWLAEKFGNASSRDHIWGWDAAEAVEDARNEVADLINSATMEIIFTSGATEALNTAIKGFVGFGGWERKKIVTCATEHDAVLAPCYQLQRTTGIEVEVLPVDRQGRIDLGRLQAALSSNKHVLAALMAANNEIGTVHPIRQIADLVHAADALFLCDI